MSYEESNNEEQSVARKPYSRPSVKRQGTVAELTLTTGAGGNDDGGGIPVYS
jgi:hypothetical protein